jgi:hypothetical protein
VTNPIIHRKKFFNGEVTPQQLHAELAWYKRTCRGCGSPPALRIQTFLLLTDLQPEARAVVDCEIALGRLHTVKMEKGPAIRIGDLFACSSCAPAAERAAAKGPSFAIVWRDTGPGPDNPIVAVPA